MDNVFLCLGVHNDCSLWAVRWLALVVLVTANEEN